MRSFIDISNTVDKLMLIDYIIAYVLTAITLVSLVLFRKRIKRSETYQRYIEIFLSVTLIVCIVSFMLWHYVNGALSLRSLPLDICPMIGVVYIISSIKKDFTIARGLIYWGIVGGLGSILLLLIPYDHATYRYYEFVILHLVNVLFSLYILIVKMEYPVRSDLKIVSIVTYSYLIIMVLLNYFLDLKFAFMHRDNSLEAIFGMFPFPFIPLMFVSTYVVQYFIFKQNENIFGGK